MAMLFVISQTFLYVHAGCHPSKMLLFVCCMLICEHMNGYIDMLHAKTTCLASPFQPSCLKLLEQSF